MFDLATLYRGNLTWLVSNTIFLSRHGSHAYGTHLPTSDVDLKGFAIPPPEYFLGCSSRFEQAESHDPDLVVYDLRKFMALAADCNPSIIEVLWTDPSDHLVTTKWGEMVRERRHLFLSRKAKHTFSGYAMAQLKRINTHHRWLVNPPKAPPTRGQFGLPEHTVIPADQIKAAQTAVRKKLDEWNGVQFLDTLDPSARVETQNRIAEYLTELHVASVEDLWRGAGGIIGLDANLLALLDRERGYGAAHREWSQYQNWKATRNEARAALETQWGYDTKHAMHLVRLMRMCREILERGEVVVKRPDAAELLEIRAGAWSYEKLIEWADVEDKALEAVAASSPLPKSPDRKDVEGLCVDVVMGFHGLRR